MGGEDEEDEEEDETERLLAEAVEGCRVAAEGLETAVSGLVQLHRHHASTVSSLSVFRWAFCSC